MRMKTTPSKPETDKSSSSEGCHALLTQPAEGNNLSKLKSPVSCEFPWATSLGAYTPALPGCFLKMEYNAKNRKQSARLIPTEVNSADRIIPSNTSLQQNVISYYQPNRTCQKPK